MLQALADQDAEREERAAAREKRAVQDMLAEPEPEPVWSAYRSPLDMSQSVFSRWVDLGRPQLAAPAPSPAPAPKGKGERLVTQAMLDEEVEIVCDAIGGFMKQMDREVEERT